MVDVLYNWPMPRKVFLKDILKQTAKETGVSEKTLLGKIRTTFIVHARHKFFYDCRDQLKISANRIGQLTKFNHVAVAHGIFWHGKRNGLPRLTGYDGESHNKKCLARYHARRAANDLP